MKAYCLLSLSSCRDADAAGHGIGCPSAWLSVVADRKEVLLRRLLEVGAVPGEGAVSSVLESIPLYFTAQFRVPYSALVASTSSRTRARCICMGNREGSPNAVASSRWPP